MRRWGLLLALAVALSGGAGWAEPPEIPVPEVAELTHEAEAELDEYDLPVASFASAQPIVRLTGAVARRAWRTPADGHTVVSVLAERTVALYDELLREGH